ncbi:PorT family protein [Brumimicrobium glaciale]|uniref:PorT family protein n=1 Tax=Brumimicrobium glaciale TaxID=200475 RepID=A0A4Q4KJ43_9FLAO|nr:porin family protein [Brumimicrobium glaciale]RYM32938.1 PorT family protein [Brumimicrobium glaciale]
MKKLLTLSLIAGLLFSVNAQDASDKKVLAGLTLGGALNFNDPETNTIDSRVGGDFIVGMALDWNFSKNIGLATGIEFDFNRFRTSYEPTVYLDYRDKDILQFRDYDVENTDNNFLLKERQHKSIYLSLPIMLKFQTNFMGYMRYYGKFGVRNSFMLTTRTNNKGQAFDVAGDLVDVTQLDDMKSPGSMSFYKGSIGIAGGAEYNISGNTVLVAELGYYYGFSEVFQQKGAVFGDDQKDLSLYQIPEGQTERTYYAPSLKQGQLMLKVSVLF